MIKTRQRKLQPAGFGFVEVIVIALIVVVLAGLGYVVFTRFVLKSDTENSNQSARSMATSAQEIPATITARAKADIAKDYDIYEGKDGNIPEGSVATITYDTAPAYKPDSLQYYISYKGGSMLYVNAKYDPSFARVPTETDVKLRAILTDSLSGQGFKRLAARDVPGYASYVKEDIVCQVSAPDYESSGANVGCGTVAAYDKEAERIAPIAKSVANVEPTTYINLQSLTDSPVEGYQRAELGIGDIGGAGYAALVYKKAGSDWTFFKGTQNGYECSQFTTTDQRNAFAGLQCYDADYKDSRVTP